MKETTRSVTKENQDIAVSSSARIRNMWTDFEQKKSRNGTFVAFDDYRQSMGGRGIWGTKIFFRALMELGFISSCPVESESNGKYCPTQKGMERYGDMFRYDQEAHLWGLSQEHLDEFDEKIFPNVVKVGRKLEIMFAAEKKEKQRARYIAKKAVEKAGEDVQMGDLI